MSEASLRPWHTNRNAPGMIFDANGEAIAVLGDLPAWQQTRYAANAALIVDAVNAQWEREAPLRAWNLPIGGGSAATPCNESLCDRPREHAPGCECAKL